MLQQLRNSRALLPFKLKPPTRHELISWTKAAWSPLQQPVIVSGFQKAVIVPEEVNTAPLIDEQRLFYSEPDWQLFNLLLDEVPVVRHIVNPNRDIDTLSAVARTDSWSS